MNRRALIVLSLVGLCCTAGLLAGAGPAPAAGTQWEYAAYRSRANRYQWQTPDTEIYARSLPEFFDQLSIKTRMSDQAAETVLVNYFGKQGWELIEMSPPAGSGGTWIFWFKRPVQ
jgi:hypothetical protein